MQRRGIILCCGMIRSASTVQYQVVADLVRRNGLGQSIGFADRQSIAEVLQKLQTVVGFAVAKTHEVLPELEALIQQDLVRPFYTFRDLRAVALSVMRKWEIPFAHVICRNGWLDTAVASSLHWLSLPDLCVSRYEDILLSLPGEIMKWAGALGLKITQLQAEELAAKYSLQAQKDRLEAMRDRPGEVGGPTSYFDPESLLHHNHIIDGSLEGWKAGLEKWQIRQIEGRFSNWLLDQGYQLTTAVSAPK
jgi:hypothetical protein